MTCNRREFVVSASAAAFAVTLHEQLGWAGESSEQEQTVANPDDSLISALRLRTAAPLDTMKEFYGRRLGLPVLEESSNALTVGGGATPITFETADPGQGRPFYHFAFNIPENKIRGARAWQLDRSELLPIFPRLRDPDYPDEVVHFRHWNAHSIFFLDPAENVVEYIARHDLGNRAWGTASRSLPMCFLQQPRFEAHARPLIGYRASRTRSRRAEWHDSKSAHGTGLCRPPANRIS